MPWYYAVAEREHALQNPTSPEKIRLLGEALRLHGGSRVLDVASGRGGPALLLAQTFGCAITCVERAPEFAEAARERFTQARVADLAEVVERDAREFAAEPEAYDAVLCLGATFIWGGLDGTLAALAPCVRAGGHVAVGEPYWRRWPLPPDLDDEGHAPLAGTVDRFARAGLPLAALIASSEDDWDRYESLHWRSLEAWLAENPDDPDAPAIRRQHEAARDRYLRWQRELLGWAVFVGWKRP
ncbi:MAG: class I SAM-dependent methyltransferase [Thermoleophilia bacterium]|nr:class I SAM-dependent methyltransferase [Thermoleophilia bacterium]